MGYQLFKADVADQTVGATTSKAVSNITWGSSQAQTAVEDAIKAIEPAYAGTSAQDAADWLSAHASGSGSATVVDANDAFGKIAAAMRTAGATATTVTPGTKSHGDTTPATVHDYTYQLKLMKVDSSDNSKGLQNAKFTIQATGADEGAGVKYVQSDGTLGDAAYEFTSAADGSIAVSGLDAGEYTVVETQAPDGYNTVPSFTFQIYPVYKETTGDVDTIRVQTSNANVSTINVYDGVVDLVVKDKAGMTLPLTGENGIALLWIVGGVMVAAGAVYLVRSRKKDKAQQ